MPATAIDLTNRRPWAITDRRLADCRDDEERRWADFYAWRAWFDDRTSGPWDEITETLDTNQQVALWQVMCAVADAEPLAPCAGQREMF